MNKIELASQLSKNANITRSNALKFLDALIEVISEELKEQGKITLTGFGTFKTAFRKEMTGINPKTGVEISIPQRRVVRFVPGKALKASAIGLHGPGSGPDEIGAHDVYRSVDSEEIEEIVENIHGPGLGPDEEL